MEEYRNEQYKKDFVRMMDSVRKSCIGKQSCAGVECEECPLEIGDIQICYSYTAMECVNAVHEWALEHPEPHIETNGEHYKKEFGHENITTCCYADEETLKNCDSECETCRYNADAPYHAPESVKE